MNFDHVFLALGALGCVAVTGVFTYCLVGALRAARLADQNPKDPAVWPKVSIVVPACNEGRTIEAAMRTLLAQNYPALEIVAVDDRSTDETGTILDRIAGEDPRLRVVHLRARPEGWLGKVHAQQRGVEVATGELILFSDADIHFSPDMLKKAVALVEEQHLDHLALLPRLHAKGLVIGTLLASFFDGFVARVRTSTVEVKKDGPPFGFGAFNLIRRATFAKTEGFEWFKMDIVDDVAIGELMRRYGRSGFAVASREFALEYYPTFGSAMLGWEKNMPGAIGQYRVLRTFVTGIIVMSIPSLPFFLLAYEGSFPARLIYLIPLVPIVLLALVGKVRFDRPFLHALLSPFSMLIVGFGILRAGVLWLRRGGIVWRGTFYSTKDLRAGARVTFP